jgi:tetratricopeptide (TPR) repeat protein
MPGMKKGPLRRLKTRDWAGFLVLTMLLSALLSILGGCATGPKELALAAPESAVAEAPPGELSRELSNKPAVARLDVGREGFVITEVPPMDEALRRDFDRAVTMLKDEDYDEAVVLLEKVIEKSPGVTAPYVDIAIAYQRTGRPELAEENLKTALELFPEHPVACNEYGLLYRRTGRFTEARAMYEKALARFPDYYPARRNLGIVCDLYLSDLACALEHYETYSEARPEDKQVKLWVADLRTRLGHD